MSVKFDGFSIRGYASKMRSVDVMKCWPFGGEGDGEGSCEVSRKDVESWLPPMTVPKFRFWSNELEALRSNQDEAGKPEDQPSEAEEVSRGDDEREPVRSDKPAGSEEEKLEMVCPVCGDFNAATLTAVNAHIDGCLGRTMMEERRQIRMMSLKSKSKAQKKRSIAEIFEAKEKEKEEEEEQQEQQQQIDTVMKFWPFNKEPDEVSITVTKFRWLSRRLEALRSNREGGKNSRSGKEPVKSGEGDSVEEQEKLEIVCPVCRDFKPATVTAVNAHIDGCLAQAVREERRQMRRMCSKPKPKAPKKRSIAEILTVAPPINAENNEVVEVEKVDEDVEDERNGNEEKSGYYGGGDSSAAAAVVSNIKGKKSRKKNMKKKVVKKKIKVKKHSVPLNNKNKKMKKGSKKKNKKMKNFFNNELTAKKDGAFKRKAQTPENSCRKQRGPIDNKTVALDDIDASAHEKKLGLKILSAEKKRNVTNFNSVGEQQKEMSSVPGILKNHLEHISGRTLSGCNIQDVTEESEFDVQFPTTDRHVRFSGKDDILGPKRRNSFDETMFSLSSNSSESEEGTANLEANGNDDNIAINIDDRKEVCPIVESKQLSNTLEQVTVQNFLKPCINEEKSKHLVEKSESLTKVAFCDSNDLNPSDRGKTSTLNCSKYADCSPYADVSGPLSALEEGQVSGINKEVCESGAFSSNGKFGDHLENPTFQADNVNSNSNTSTFLKPSLTFSASYNKANERPEFPLHTYGDNDTSGRILGGRLLSNMFYSDRIDNSFPLPSWGKGTVRNNCMDPSFFGLPLNSQGELINFSSSEKVGMNQPETASTIRGSLSGLSVNDTLHQSSQEYLSIRERHVVQKTLPKDRGNIFPHYPARLGVTELSGSDRADTHWLNSDRFSNHYVQPLHSELSPMKNPFIEHSQRDIVQNHKGNGMISPKESSDFIPPSSTQPTMRLMGKDVPIGRCNQGMQQFVRGDVWADEESKRRHYSEGAALENSLLGRCSNRDWISGSPLQISTENVLQSAKIPNNQALQRNLMMKGPDSEFPFMQSNHVSQNGSFGVSGSASSYLHPSTQAPTSCAAFNGATDELPEQIIIGAKPLGLSSQSQVLPTPWNFSQPTSLSSGELNDRKKHHHVTNSVFEFPFLHPVVEEHGKTSWFQRSHRSLPRWFLSSTRERLPGTSCQQFSAASSNSSPQNMWGNNSSTQSENHSAEVLYPSNSLTSHCPRRTPLCPASIVQPPHVPVTSVTKPPSTINSGCRNTIVPDRVKLDDLITEDHHPCTNPRKRPATNIDDPTKSIKLPNMEVQENLSRLTGMTRENSSAELQRNARADELDPRVDSARDKYCQSEAQNLNPRSYLGVDSPKMDGMVISAPVKLCPGAKYILKPSHNIDQDISRPIHSAIPLAATTDCGRDLELQRKLTKIYRF